MSVVLSIETSTSVCSAALHENGNVLASMELHTPQSAASQLAIQIETLFRDSKLSKDSLSAVAVSSGPGSYTGLRIGVATAKGICVGLDVPLISIDSLLVLASQISSSEGGDLLCPMIDARRMEVYCSLFDRSGNVLQKTEAKIIDETSYLEHLSQYSILFFGDGAAKCRDVINHPNAKFIDHIYPKAAQMGNLAFQKLKANQFEQLNTFEPNYLKDFVAKTKSS